MSSVDRTYRVRPPAVAGAFYPGDAEALRNSLTDLMGSAVSKPRPAARALIAPHAGYVYSGAVAAEAFASVQGAPGRFRRVVVIGPSHFVPFEGLAAPSHTAFETPLGSLPVDTEAVADLAALGLALIDDAPHGPDHAIEVELPFIQTVLGDLPIVALLTGSVSAEQVAAAIAHLWTEDTLVVVSSDLSHFEPYRSANRHDSNTAAAIERFEGAAIGPNDACGHLAIRGLLIETARRRLGIERLDLRNSGDTAGDRASVVGYGAWVLSDAHRPTGEPRSD